jgi:hypothetical protein
MTDPSYKCSSSTNWEWKKVKIKAAPAQGSSGPKALRTPLRLARRNRNRPIWVEATYRGGAESSWTFRFRDITWRVPGWWTVEDLMAMVNGEW